MLYLLGAEEAMPALPWPYVAALCSAFAIALGAMWRRDVAREVAAAAREEKRDAMILTMIPVLEKSKDALERLAKRTP